MQKFYSTQHEEVAPCYLQTNTTSEWFQNLAQTIDIIMDDSDKLPSLPASGARKTESSPLKNLATRQNLLSCCHTAEVREELSL